MRIKSKFKTVFIYSVLALLGCAGIISVTGITHATGWPNDVSYKLDYLATTPDGKVAASKCSYGSADSTPDLQLFSSTGTVLHTHNRIATDILTACGNGQFTNSPITTNGTVVGTEYDSTASSNYYKAVGYSSSGTKLWTYSYPNLCGSTGRPYSQKRIAADGSVYFTMESRCTYGSAYELVNLNATTGATNFHVALAPNSEKLDSADGLRAYEDGYVYYNQGATEFVYLNSSGVKDTSRSFTISGSYYNKPVTWALGATGKLSIFVANVSSSGSSCTTSDTSKLFTKVPGQTLQTYDYGICAKYINYMSAMPGGETLLYTSNDKNMYKIGNDGSVVYDKSLATESGVGSSISNGTLAVDTQGNVLATVRYITPGNSVNAAKLLLFNPSGQVISKFETNSFLSPTEINQKPQTVRSVGMMNGNLYLLVSSYSSEDAVLHKIPFAKISIDYPRGTLLGDTSVPDVKKYVALGDSFSSGESVAPFITGTDVSGVNECHRSSLAYPVLLSQDPELNFNLAPSDFVACSGATRNNIYTSGQWSEPKQLDAITADTDLVTMTIGGNDAGFGYFASECVLSPSTCDLQSAIYQTALAGASGTTFLNTMLDELEEKLNDLNNTSAKVLVIGYPNFLQTSIPSPNECLWLTGTEPDAIRNVQATLNATNKARVEAKGGQFIYVSPTESNSPFNNHEICRNDSSNDYLNGLITSPSVFSFHPKATGQSAYVKILKDYIQTNL